MLFPSCERRWQRDAREPLTNCRFTDRAVSINKCCFGKRHHCGRPEQNTIDDFKAIYPTEWCGKTNHLAFAARFVKSFPLL